MAKEPRVVAELGRPETAEETAVRKAANSKAYRDSQNFRNLVVALLATLAIVLVIFFAVPRGEPAPRPTIDPAQVAAEAGSQFPTVIVPAVPEDLGWTVNQAQFEGAEWHIVYLPADQSFLRFAQGFGADETWAAQVLGGSAPTDELVIGDITWQVYEVDPGENGNVTYALGTQAGPDHILLYGSSTPEKTAEAAEIVAPDVRALMEESE
ncbi:DUF4245 family protein [Microbacterium sp. JZ31]|uniref:DUF4245 family protein n=1 Tax=Microbacterium sp. JZ31 TaxID=1906274 RepID=UPI0019348617|nr:DUF4245 family protein [Microbacterium sp. JZ31]